MRSRCSGAPLWSPPTSRTRSRSPSTRDGGDSPALQRQGAAPRGRERRPTSCSPDPCVPIEDRAAYGSSADPRLDPPRAGPEPLPLGSFAPQARAGSDPRQGVRIKPRVKGAASFIRTKAAPRVVPEGCIPSGSKASVRAGDRLRPAPTARLIPMGRLLRATGATRAPVLVESLGEPDGRFHHARRGSRRMWSRRCSDF